MTVRHISALLLLALCTDCASRTSIDSNKQPGYAFTEERLLVIDQSTADPIQQGFQAAFPKAMNSCGVKLVTITLPEKLDDTQEARDKAAGVIHQFVHQYNLKTRLEIRRDSTTIQTIYGAPAGALSYSYQATMKDSQDNKLWTSIIDLRPNRLVAGGISGTNTASMGEVLAHDIVEKLKDDGVLLKCPDKIPESE